MAKRKGTPEVWAMAERLRAKGDTYESISRQIHAEFGQRFAPHTIRRWCITEHGPRRGIPDVPGVCVQMGVVRCVRCGNWVGKNVTRRHNGEIHCRPCYRAVAVDETREHYDAARRENERATRMKNDAFARLREQSIAALS